MDLVGRFWYSSSDSLLVIFGEYGRHGELGTTRSGVERERGEAVDVRRFVSRQAAQRMSGGEMTAVWLAMEEQYGRLGYGSLAASNGVSE